MNPFSRACRAGNFSVVMTILKTNPNSTSRFLKLTDANGWNCLQWTAWHSNVECMKFLLTLKDVDVNVKDTSGRTALHIALLPQTEQEFQKERGRFGYPRQPSYEIVKMLLEAAVNSKAVSCFGEQCPTILAVALMSHHLDVVKLLIDCIAFQRFSKDIFWHTAAVFQRVDCMRYLLCTPGYDLKTRNNVGWQPCFVFIQNVLIDIEEPSQAEMEFCVELLLLTVKSPVDTVEVFFMLLDCFRYKDQNNDGRAHNIFVEIVKLLLTHNHPKKQLIDKILSKKLPSFYSLVGLILLEGIKDKIENCKLIKPVMDRYFGYLEDMERFLLQELFMLFSVEESLFNEYIAEVVEMGWSFDKCVLSSLLRVALTQQTTRQHLFNFTKSLIFNQFNFITLRPLAPPPPLADLLSPPSVLKCRIQVMNDFLLHVFVPLSKCVQAPIELMKVLRWVKCDRHFDFNESENCMHDYIRLIQQRNTHQPEVVSLKNLSRMSVRKLMFTKLTHYDALTTMYSLDIPLELRQFLCYNHSNLKF